MNGAWSHNPAPQECASCHSTNAKASGWSQWAVEAVMPGISLARTQKGVFHSAVTTVKTCYSCHLAERPDGPVGVNNFDHDNQGAVGDCVNCHGTFPQNIGLKWKMDL